MTQKTTRRDFVKQTALGVGGAWWLGTQSLSAQERSPVERLNFACIGVPIKISQQGSYSAVLTAMGVNQTVKWRLK